MRAGAGERPGGSATEKPVKGKYCYPRAMGRAKWMEARILVTRAVNTEGVREGEGAPESLPEPQLSGNTEGQHSNLGNLSPFHRKGVRHPAAVPDADWGGDIHPVQQDLSAHHGEVHRHLLCTLLFSLLPGHPPDWVRQEQFLLSGLGLRSRTVGAFPAYYRKVFTFHIYTTGSE